LISLCVANIKQNTYHKQPIGLRSWNTIVKDALQNLTEVARKRLMPPRKFCENVGFPISDIVSVAGLRKRSEKKQGLLYFEPEIEQAVI